MFDTFSSIPALMEPEQLLVARRSLDNIESSFPRFLNLSSLKDTVFAQEASDLTEEAIRRLVNAASSELKLAQDERASGNTKATKPVEVYRRFAGLLRSAVKQGGDMGMVAQETLNDLYLAQSLPDSELEVKDWLDPYTKEPDPEYSEWAQAIPEIREAGVEALLKAAESAPVVVSAPSSWNQQLAQWVERNRVEHGWDAKRCEEFYKANQTWEDGDDEPDFDDDRGYVPPTLISPELTLDYSLLRRGQRIIQRIEDKGKRILENLQLLGTYEEQPEDKRMSMLYDDVRTIQVHRGAFSGLLKYLKFVAETDIATAATLFLLAQGDGGLEACDVQDIRGYTPTNTWMPLAKYAYEWADDLLDQVRDAGPSGKFLTSEGDIRKYADDTAIELKNVLPETSGIPQNTQAYALTYVEAIAAGSSPKEAEDAAWHNWRHTMCKPAAQEYDRVFAATSDRTQAMRAFWRIAPPSVPRPQEIISSLRGDKKGLVLASGRRIEWPVAVMKVKAKELYLPEWMKQTLAQKLKDNTMASRFLEAIK